MGADPWLLQVYLTVTLGFYSSTHEISLTATRWVFSQLASLAKSGLDYLPNLAIIAVIVLVTSYLIRLYARFLATLVRAI